MIAATLAITTLLVSAMPSTTNDGDVTLDVFLATCAATLIATAAVMGFVRWRIEGRTALLWMSTSLALVAVAIVVIEIISLRGRPDDQLTAVATAAIVAALATGFRAMGPVIDTSVRVGQVAATVAVTFAVGLVSCWLAGAGLALDASTGGTEAALWSSVALAWTLVALLVVARLRQRRTRAFVWFGVLALTLAQYAGAAALLIAWERPVARGHMALLVVGATAMCIGAVSDLKQTFIVQRSELLSSTVLAGSLRARMDMARDGAEQRAHSARNALCAIAGATQLLEEHHDRLPAETRATLVESVASEVARLQELIALDVLEERDRLASDRGSVDSPSDSPAVDAI